MSLRRAWDAPIEVGYDGAWYVPLRDEDAWAMAAYRGDADGGVKRADSNGVGWAELVTVYCC